MNLKRATNIERAGPAGKYPSCSNWNKKKQVETGHTIILKLKKRSMISVRWIPSLVDL